MIVYIWSWEWQCSFRRWYVVLANSLAEARQLAIAGAERAENTDDVRRLDVEDPAISQDRPRCWVFEEEED